MPPEQAEHADQLEVTTIVLVGRFNPRILQPLWFVTKGLLASADVEPENLILTDGVAAYETTAFALVCSQDRCQFATTPRTPTPDLLRDIVVGAFTVLSETPIWEFGINHFAHFPADVRRWDELTAQMGDPQRTFVLLSDQTLQTVEFRADRTDDYNGRQTVQLQPSVQLKDGIFVSFNDHFDVIPEADRDRPAGAHPAVQILESVWSSTAEATDTLMSQIAPR